MKLHVAGRRRETGGWKKYSEHSIAREIAFVSVRSVLVSDCSLGPRRLDRHYPKWAGLTARWPIFSAATEAQADREELLLRAKPRRKERDCSKLHTAARAGASPCSFTFPSASGGFAPAVGPFRACS